MKEELMTWKRENGSVTYTTKELIQGLHVKVDKMVCKSDCLRRSSTLRNMIVGMFGFIISLIGVVAAKAFGILK